MTITPGITLMHSPFIDVIIVDPYLKRTKFHEYPRSENEEPKHGEMGWPLKESQLLTWRKVLDDARQGEYKAFVNICDEAEYALHIQDEYSRTKDPKN